MKFLSPSSAKLQEQIKDPSKDVCNEDQANRVPKPSNCKRKKIYDVMSKLDSISVPAWGRALRDGFIGNFRSLV